MRIFFRLPARNVGAKFFKPELSAALAARHTPRAPRSPPRSLRGKPRHTRLEPRTPDMTSPSTSRDRVETGAQASGGNDVVDAGKPREASQDSTEEAALALKRAELKQAETNMMEVANRARDESNPPTGEDIKKALDRFHAAADATPRPASHAADDRGPQLPPGTAVAGSKRPSDPVARRFTREDVSAPPEERHRDDDAATMDVDDDDAFAPVGKFPNSQKVFASWRVAPSRATGFFAENDNVMCFRVPSLSGDARCLRPRGPSARLREPCEWSRVGLAAFAHCAAARDVCDRARARGVFVTRERD